MVLFAFFQGMSSKEIKQQLEARLEWTEAEERGGNKFLGLPFTLEFAWFFKLYF